MPKTLKEIYFIFFKKVETIEAIKARYSCRHYSTKPVAKAVITELLELANMAPSAGNQQNRHFVVITGREDRKYLGNMNNQKHLADAPAVILVASKVSKETAEEYLDGLKKWEMTVNSTKPDDFRVTPEFAAEVKALQSKWDISDAAAAVENLMLAAVDKGLSTCWVGIMDFNGVIKRFGLPEDYMPICLVTLGYQKEEPVRRASRKNISELIHWEKW